MEISFGYRLAQKNSVRNNPNGNHNPKLWIQRKTNTNYLFFRSVMQTSTNNKHKNTSFNRLPFLFEKFWMNMMQNFMNRHHNRCSKKFCIKNLSHNERYPYQIKMRNFNTFRHQLKKRYPQFSSVSIRRVISSAHIKIKNNIYHYVRRDINSSNCSWSGRIWR